MAIGWARWAEWVRRWPAWCAIVALAVLALPARPALAATVQPDDPARLAASSAPVDTTPDWRFGVIEAYESPPDAAALGAAWTRVRFQWAEVQAAGPGSWAPPVDDAALAVEAAAGRQVVGMLIGIPDWARGPDRLPGGLWLPPDDPGNLWAAFVHQAVARYAGRIDHWIIWNEPDVWDPAAPGHTWDGDVDDFLQLQRIAYQSARAANPAAVLHLAATTYFWDAQYGREQYFARLLDRLVADPAAAAHDYYFDVATAHLYFQPNTVYDVLTEFRRMLAERGLDKPIWLVETNAPPIDDPAWPVSSVTLRVAQSEQAAYMPQALAAALAAGAERVAIYKLQDTEDDLLANPEPFGLVRRDGSRRPAFATARLAFAMMSGVLASDRQRWDAVGQVRLVQPDRLTTVLFARLPAAQTALVPALAETARLVDMQGQERLLTATDSVFRVSLPPALCSQSIGDYCMIGGEVFYLVQARDGGPPPTGYPAPAPAPRWSPTVAGNSGELPHEASGQLSGNSGELPHEANGQPSGNSGALPHEASGQLLGDAGEAPDGQLPDGGTVELDFPRSLTFALELAQPARSAVLAYDIEGEGCLEAATRVQVEPDGNRLSWEWSFSRSGSPPPGARIWWEWTVTDATGATLTAPRQTTTIVDPRFTWRQVEGDGVVVWWYRGDAVGPELLEAAGESLGRLESQMGIELQREATIVVYGDTADMRDAVLYVQDWTGALAFADYNIILMGVTPSNLESWGKPTVAHELAHLVLGQFGRSCVGGSRPTWLEEGLAVWAEGEPSETVRDEIAAGIRNDSFVPVRSLNGAFAADIEAASSAYSQSYSLVNYLLATFGEERLQDLILTLADGATYDEALETVYGFNTDGLELAWRAAIGAPPRAIPPTPTPIDPAAVPTVPPVALVVSVPTPPAAASPPSPAPAPSAGICAAALLPLGLALGVRKRLAG